MQTQFIHVGPTVSLCALKRLSVNKQRGVHIRKDKCKKKDRWRINVERKRYCKKKTDGELREL
jgi:hypothetical protein